MCVFMALPSYWRFNPGGPVSPMPRERRVNDWLRAALEGREETHLLEMEALLPPDWWGEERFHYQRQAYLLAARKIAALVQERFGN